MPRISFCAARKTKQMTKIMNNNQNQEPSLEETWKATVLPRHEANQKVFERFLQTPDHNGHVLNCAIPR
jgi:hypothetical protein